MLQGYILLQPKKQVKCPICLIQIPLTTELYNFLLLQLYFLHESAHFTNCLHRSCIKSFFLKVIIMNASYSGYQSVIKDPEVPKTPKTGVPVVNN